MNHKITKAYCNQCSGETRHNTLHSARRFWIDILEDDFTHEESATYDMLQCCGCEEIKLQVMSYGPWPESAPDYFPPAIFRRRPEWLHELESDVSNGGVMQSMASLLSEVYRALQNGMPRLAAMGVRAALELIMIDKVGDNQSFKANVTKFAEQGYIAHKQVERIMSVLDAGGAVIHRGYAPTDADVIAMVDLTENLVESTYIHEQSILAMVKGVPPRPNVSKNLKK